jgi:hypothetical protein
MAALPFQRLRLTLDDLFNRDSTTTNSAKLYARGASPAMILRSTGRPCTPADKKALNCITATLTGANVRETMAEYGDPPLPRNRRVIPAADSNISTMVALRPNPYLPAAAVVRARATTCEAKVQAPTDTMREQPRKRPRKGVADGASPLQRANA